MKPFSPACERNREPIRQQLERLLTSATHVLEIGSGTGQHAVYFGESMPHLTWQTSDLSINHRSITHWLEDSSAGNILPPIVLDVDSHWPEETYGAIFTANTLHIVSEKQGERLIAGAAKLLEAGGLLIVYGPFLINGVHISESNRNFDKQLRVRDSGSGIRDRELLIAFAKGEGLDFLEDNPMPANNRLLVWRKRAVSV